MAANDGVRMSMYGTSVFSATNSVALVYCTKVFSLSWNLLDFGGLKYFDSIKTPHGLARATHLLRF